VSTSVDLEMNKAIEREALQVVPELVQKILTLKNRYRNPVKISVGMRRTSLID
jgi:hypothetical protein